MTLRLEGQRLTWKDYTLAKRGNTWISETAKHHVPADEQIYSSLYPKTYTRTYGIEIW